MSHLKDVNMTYWQHFKRAWSIAGILLVHGVFPNIWKTKASDMICKDHVSSTRKYLLNYLGVKED